MVIDYVLGFCLVNAKQITKTGSLVPVFFKAKQQLAPMPKNLVSFRDSNRLLGVVARKVNTRSM